MTHSFKLPASIPINKEQAIKVGVIVLVIILLMTVGIPAIIKGISSLISSMVKGASNAANEALGNVGSQGIDAHIAASTWNNNYRKAMGDNDPFGVKLYPQHADASNLDYPTLVKAAKDVRDSMGTGFMGLKFSNGDPVAFARAFDPISTQTDASNIAVVYNEIYKGNMMYDAIYDPILQVGIPDADSLGNDGSVELQTFIQKVNKLPVY